MRALLLYNPNATTTNAAVTEVIARRLAAELKLEVAPTKRRDHASYLAASAPHEGFEAVIALGGDGTVNEVIQGLAGTTVPLAIIPGGSTNVWARTLGLPNDAEAATEIILERLRERDLQRVNLGTANGRYFCFSAGYGYDACVVAAVERRHRLKRTVRQASFLYSGVTAYAFDYDRKHADIAVRADGSAPVDGIRAVVCCNSSPYTYLGPWAAQLCPGADLAGDLSLTGLTKLSVPALLRLARAALSGGDVRSLPFTRLWDSAREVELTSAKPLALQLDGDYVGQTTKVLLRSASASLTVVA